MPRASRQMSSTGMYHALLRGVNQQRIFEEESDYLYFLNKLQEIRSEAGISLLCYCLMSNHVHLLLKEGTSSLSHLFRRLGPSYVYYFNKKYDRSGHLFQDRFKSEPVEDNAYLLAVINYIHYNPVQAGLSEAAESYRWSSLNSLGCSNSIVDEGELFSLIDEQSLQSAAKYRSDVEPFKARKRGRRSRYSEEDAIVHMKALCGAASASQFQKLSLVEQKEAIGALSSRGVSIRLAARISGMSKGLIERWMAENNRT